MQRVKVMLVGFLMASFLTLVPVLLWADEESWGEKTSCKGPTDIVQVIVKQESESPPIYSYAIKNTHSSSITISILALGDSDHEEMYSITDNIPKSFTSPKGWTSGISPTDESPMTRLYWKTKNHLTLAPGETFGGFKLEVPEPFEKGATHGLIGGKMVRLLSMKEMPFSVYLRKGPEGQKRVSYNPCDWGKLTQWSDNKKP